MTAAILRLPCAHEGFYLARRVLRDPDSTPEQIDAALEVLDASRDWMDLDLCRQMREAIRRAAPAQETCRLTDAEMAAVMHRAPVRPSAADYRAQALPVLAFCAVALAGLVLTLVMP